jgi:hypothetical protein
VGHPPARIVGQGSERLAGAEKLEQVTEKFGQSKLGVRHATRLLRQQQAPQGGVRGAGKLGELAGETAVETIYRTQIPTIPPPLQRRNDGNCSRQLFRSLNRVKGFFVVFLTLLIMGWVVAQARAAKAHQLGNDWIFPTIRVLQTICAIAISMGVWFMFFGLRTTATDRAISVTVGFSIIVFTAITWPKAIPLSESGLRQRSWRWGWKRIAWSEVSEVKENRDGSVVIRRKQTKIVLSQFHAGHKLFVGQLHRLNPLPST